MLTAVSSALLLCLVLSLAHTHTRTHTHQDASPAVLTFVPLLLLSVEDEFERGISSDLQEAKLSLRADLTQTKNTCFATDLCLCTDFTAFCAINMGNYYILVILKGLS